MILCRSEKAVWSGHEVMILSSPAFSVPVLQLARPEVQRRLAAYKEFHMTLLGRNCIVTRAKEEAVCFHSVVECSRRKRLGVGKLGPWAASLSLPPMEEEKRSWLQRLH